MEYLTKWIDYVDKAPPLLLTALLALAFGYSLRRADWVPNKRIPVLLMFFGAVMYPLMSYGLTSFIVKGALTSCGVWVLHKFLLKPLEDKFPWIKKMVAGDNGNYDTDIIVKAQVKTDVEPKVEVEIVKKPPEGPETK